MEEIVWAGNLALGPNLSVVTLNRSFSSLWAAPGQPGRMISATAILLLALVGNCLLLHRLHCGGCCCEGRFGRRRKMDFLLAHLAVASLYGCGLALFSHFPAEGAPPGHAEWSSSGDATCRLLRLLQGSGLLAPSHMLVLIALERRHMAKGPSPPPRPPSPSQRKPWLPPSRPAQGTLAALGWLLAVLLALPQAFVYRLTPAERGGRCLSIFAQLPRWQGQTYALYGAITGFVAPACFLGGTCGGIISALSSTASTKGKEPARGAPAAAANSAPQSRARLPGAGDGGAAPAPVPSRSRLLLCLWPAAKCALPSLPAAAAAAPRSLPRARARALQLTLALTTVFALCGFPRFLLELGLAFVSSESGVDDSRTSLGSLMAATNSAVNPYVCLLFNSHQPWARHVQRRLCCCPHGQPRRRAHHRHHPPPQALADGRPGRWLCPCQSRPPTVSTVVQQEEIEAQPLDPCESRF